MAELSEKELEHLSGLARISIEKDEEKLLGDLRNILAYFKNLEEVETADVPPMTGGTTLINILRKDEPGEKLTESSKLISQFREEEGGYLKVPPVFKREK